MLKSFLTSVTSLRPHLQYGVLALSLTLLLPACSGLTGKSTLPQDDSARPAPTVIDDRPFAADTLYSLLVAEMAGDRQRFDVMLGNYVQQAEKTRDPGITARAAILARYLSVHPVALDMAQLWLELQPHNLDAHHLAMVEFIHHNRLVEATDHAIIMLRAGEIGEFDAIGARAQQAADPEVTDTLIERFESLLNDYPRHPPLRVGLSLLYQHKGQLTEALDQVQTALKIDSDDFQAAALETRILQQMGKEDLARGKLGAMVDRHPDNQRLRIQYARSLLKTDLTSAQAQFEKLVELAPEDQDLRLTLALVQYEQGLFEQARQQLTPLLNNADHASTAHYYLGRIALAQKKPDQASEHFRAVEPGPDYLPAMSQLTALMSAQDQTEEAIKIIRAARANARDKTPEHIEGLHLLEAHMFSTQGKQRAAIESLNQAIEQFPESTRLIYGRAMLHVESKRFEQAEADFQRVLTLEPNHAAALNAWGYTLADRNERLQEAYDYISRAYQLTPEDPAVIDSMGWIEYRTGNIDAAVELLQQAMHKVNDHEIAAHLGEVLWVSGQREEAKAVWQRGLQNHPDSPIIREAMRRLNIHGED